MDDDDDDAYIFHSDLSPTPSPNVYRDGTKIRSLHGLNFRHHSLLSRAADARIKMEQGTVYM